MTHNQLTITRRSALGAAALVASSGAASAAAPDPIDPKSMLEVYTRLRFRSDGKPTYTAYRATIFGKAEGEKAVACFDVEGVSWGRATRLDESRTQFDMVEAGYYLDRETGKPLDIWRNPMNGLDCKVKHYRSFLKSTVTSEGKIVRPETPGVEFTGTVPAPTVIADQIWMHEELIVRIANKPRDSFADPLEYVGPAATATSLATYTAKLSDILNPRLPFVTATVHFQTANSWQPFMRMGSAPGVFMWRMYGVKQPTPDHVPAHLRERVLKDYPDFFERL